MSISGPKRIDVGGVRASTFAASPIYLQRHRPEFHGLSHYPSNRPCIIIQPKPWVVLKIQLLQNVIQSPDGIIPVPLKSSRIQVCISAKPPDWSSIEPCSEQTRSTQYGTIIPISPSARTRWVCLPVCIRSSSFRRRVWPRSMTKPRMSTIAYQSSDLLAGRREEVENSEAAK